MKSDIAYYLLLLYITVMIHPLLPVAHDWWEHEFNETEHLSHVHSHKGNDHLEKELKNSNSENTTNKNQNSLKAEDQVSFHVSPSIYKDNFSVNKTHLQHQLLNLNKPAFVFIFLKSPPPKFS